MPFARFLSKHAPATLRNNRDETFPGYWSIFSSNVLLVFAGGQVQGDGCRLFRTTTYDFRANHTTEQCGRVDLLSTVEVDADCDFDTAKFLIRIALRSLLESRDNQQGRALIASYENLPALELVISSGNRLSTLRRSLLKLCSFSCQTLPETCHIMLCQPNDPVQDGAKAPVEIDLYRYESVKAAAKAASTDVSQTIGEVRRGRVQRAIDRYRRRLYEYRCRSLPIDYLEAVGLRDLATEAELVPPDTDLKFFYDQVNIAQKLYFRLPESLCAWAMLVDLQTIEIVLESLDCSRLNIAENIKMLSALIGEQLPDIDKAVLSRDLWSVMERVDHDKR